MMTFMAVVMGLRLLFYILLGVEVRVPARYTALSSLGWSGVRGDGVEGLKRVYDRVWL